MQLRTLTLVLGIALATACGGVDSEDDGNNTPDAGDNQADAAPNVDAAQLAVAPPDNDSAAAPAESHFLSITGERDFTYTDEVSFPTGDPEDFIQFEFPNNANPAQIVRITLDCTITGQVDAQGSVVITEDGDTAGTVFCNDGEQTVTVNNTLEQIAQIGFSTVADPSHIDYTLTVVGFQ